MSQQAGRQPGQHSAAAAAAQQLRYGAATPPVQQQLPPNSNAWANPAAQLLQLHGRASPGPGQTLTGLPGGGNAQINTTNPAQHLLQLQFLQAQAQAQARNLQLTPQQVMALMQQQQQAQMRAAQQTAKRPGPAPSAASAAAQGTTQQVPLPSVNSAGNLQGLVQQGNSQQQTAARLGSTSSFAAAGNAAQRPLQPSGLAMQGMRPGLSVPGAHGMVGVAPGLLNAAGISQQTVATLDARNHLASLKPGEQPRVPLPDTHEWVQCLDRTGQATWVALSKPGAAKYRADQKRKAEEVAGILPATKIAGGVVRRRIDDDYTAGGGDRALDVMADDELQAELAVNEAAKGAVQVQQGNVQEEFILNQGPTLQLIAGIAKKNGVRQVSEDLYAFLSLAADAHLSQLLHGLVKSRLQREDIGKSYESVERQDDNVRSRLYQIQKREKEAAAERKAKENDELAKLSGTRKKLAEDEKKAAKEASLRKQLELSQKNLGSTLSKMGIGKKSFSMAALGRPPGAPAKAGVTKPELVQAKAAATAAAPANGNMSGKNEATGDGLSMQQQQSRAGNAAGPSAAADAGAPPLKPVTLQHQLLTAANAPGGPGAGGPVAFVAGGSGRSMGKDGEEGLRKIALRDLIAVLERHPLYCRSQLLYRLYILDGNKWLSSHHGRP